MKKIIDFHAHIFPDKLAPKAVKNLNEFYNIEIMCDGTIDGLIEQMDRAGVEKSVVHSTATTSAQVMSINNWLSSIDNDRFIVFGTIYPFYEDIEQEVERIIELGLKGIKLHPDFQRCNIDSKEMFRIFKAVNGRIPILIHLGDNRYDFSSPKRMARALDAFGDQVFIGAHLGGYSAWDEAMECLCGRNIYLDTSSSMRFMEPLRAYEIIQKHGTDKILFGSDYPMSNPSYELEILKKLGLNEKETEDILYNNACRIL